MNVCLSTDSGGKADISQPPLRGHNRKYKVHSITSSARARIEGGIVIPSVLAIFRLTIRSILVGSWTGRSEGLAPLRILVDVTGALAENGFDVRHVTQETASSLRTRSADGARAQGRPNAPDGCK
jgi:hypothetical protein